MLVDNKPNLFALHNELVSFSDEAKEQVKVTFCSVSLRFWSSCLIANNFHFTNLARSGNGIGSPLSRWTFAVSQISANAGTSFGFLPLGLPSS